MRGVDVTSVKVIPSWGNSPARSLRSTGRVDINAAFLPVIAKMYKPKHIWAYIYQHERGHIVLNTTNELEADSYASREYFKQGGSPIASILALSNILPKQSPLSIQRIKAQYYRAVEHECNNGNSKMCDKMRSFSPNKSGYTNFSINLFGKRLEICGPICQANKRKAEAAKLAAQQISQQLAAQQAYQAQRLRAEAEAAQTVAKTEAQKAVAETSATTMLLAAGAVLLLLFFIAKKRGLV